MRGPAVVAVVLALMAGACFSSSETEPTERVRLSFDPFTPVPTTTPTPEVTATPEIPRRTLGPQAAPGPAATSAPTTVDCPVGEVRASITEVVVLDRGPGLWDVRVDGEVRNDTQGMVRDVEVRIEVRVPGADEERGSVVVTGPLAPGSSARWTETVDVESEEEPEEEHVSVGVRDWSWGEADKDAVCARGTRGP